MTRSRNYNKQFRPEFPGTQPVESDANKGKKMNTKGSAQPDYVPSKGKK
ncbi:small acid-soluble spore protein N [Salipaludibacillus sp. HK11]